jgi:hypothetical protein
MDGVMCDFLQASKLPARRSTLNSTSGGSSDTELNELTVMPSRSPRALMAVTMTTPVGNRPRASRKLRLSNGIAKAPVSTLAYLQSYVTKLSTMTQEHGGDSAMLVFERHSGHGRDRVKFEPEMLIVAGWTGRDEAALRHHIEELAAIGVPRPSSVPVFYRNSTVNLTQAERLDVLGPDTSGEVEPVIVAMHDGLWLGLGSDHTDRKAETMGIALSKQLCGKPLARTLWRLDEVAEHWDRLALRSFATIAGRRVKYQDGLLAAMRTPADLMARYGTLAPGAIMFCGTLGAIGGIRPADRFEMELEDPVAGRSMTHAYDVHPLPIVT